MKQKHKTTQKHPTTGNAKRELESCAARNGIRQTWGSVLSSIACGVIGILVATVAGFMERRSDLYSKCEELSGQKETLKRRVQDLQHEKAVYDLNIKNRIERLEETSVEKDVKINDLKRENSEYRIRLEGKETLIELLRKGTGAEEIKNQQDMDDVIKSKVVKPTVVETTKPLARTPRKFDIEFTKSDRENSLSAVQFYAAQDFSNAVKKARSVYDRIGKALEGAFGKRVFLHRDFNSIMAPVCRIVAEDSFARGDFANSVTQSWLAVCLEKPCPNPFSLALNSAAQSRSSLYSIGFLTVGIQESIMGQPEEHRNEYQNRILSTLRNMGYLQIAFPNKDGTGVGEVIDWMKMSGVQQPFYFKRGDRGDLWSMRWEGFGKYSEYNYTKAFEKGLALSKKSTR